MVHSLALAAACLGWLTSLTCPFDMGGRLCGLATRIKELGLHGLLGTVLELAVSAFPFSVIGVIDVVFELYSRLLVALEGLLDVKLRFP